MCMCVLLSRCSHSRAIFEQLYVIYSYILFAFRMTLLFLWIFIPGFVQVICANRTESLEHEGFGYGEDDPLGMFYLTMFLQFLFDEPTSTHLTGIPIFPFDVVFRSVIISVVSRGSFANCPEEWPKKYEKCAGKYQSPIDIEETSVIRVSLAPLKLTGFFTPPESALITNNGHTVIVTADFSVPVTIAGGPLIMPSYKFAQFHFHWGANDSLGSEDLINNHSYPMELHMVFYNEDYKDAQKAQQYIDGLAVLAYFFEVSKRDNPAYKHIVESLQYITAPHTSTNLTGNFTLQSLLPTNIDNYFTYMGSLTTPPCSEGVRWIDFKHPIQLSHSQLEEFRRIHSNAGLLTRNFRPIQPLSSRPVWYNSGSPTSLELESSGKGGSIKNQMNPLLFIYVILVPKLLVL